MESSNWWYWLTYTRNVLLKAQRIVHDWDYFYILEDFENASPAGAQFNEAFWLFLCLNCGVYDTKSPKEFIEFF